MTKSKTTKTQLTELLGMSPSAADRKLRKAIIHELARQLGKNRCLECGLSISDPDDLAIIHVEEWTDGPSFFDLDNVAFSHASCRAGRQDRRQGEREMKRVEVIVEDSKGRPLRGCMHENQLYVAGNKDQRYQVRVKNRTAKRLCVVVTVDGRNVNTGEKGSWDGSGFVLEPHQEWVFKGWRQSNDSVAAFRLGSKKDAYSSQMGTEENVGIIGVAVFEEKKLEKPTITIKEVQYIPLPYPVYPSFPPSFRPYPWTHETIVAHPDTIPPGTYTVPLGMRSNSGVFSCSVASQPVTSNISISHQKAHQQVLGTEYGETLTSKVEDVAFIRGSSTPVELYLLRYDSLAALKKAGIMTGRPSQKKPQAFPESPEAEVGFCQPPARRRFT